MIIKINKDLLTDPTEFAFASLLRYAVRRYVTL